MWKFDFSDSRNDLCSARAIQSTRVIIVNWCLTPKMTICRRIIKKRRWEPLFYLEWYYFYNKLLLFQVKNRYGTVFPFVSNGIFNLTKQFLFFYKAAVFSYILFLCNSEIWKNTNFCKVSSSYRKSKRV
jgi:hypothetical protein